MRIGTIQKGRLGVAMATTALVAAALPAAAVAQAEGEPAQVCELAYYTGSYADYGPNLTNDVRFAVEDVVNTDPPLGRPWELISEDIGDSFEGEAARKCIEQHGAEIVVSMAHQYRNYRDYVREVWAETDSPLAPTVHGGAIPASLGGTVEEPLFRAQGSDQALGLFGTLYADQIGAKNVVIFATQVEGFQLAADGNEDGAEILGLNVIERIDAPAQQASYRAEAQRIAEANPDAVLVQAGSNESAALIKSADEAGLSLNWIGETGWSEPEFAEQLGTAPLASQKGIGYASYAADQSTPAWEYFQPLWDAQVNCAEGTEDCPPYDASQQYAFSTYDILVQTALAVEAGGSYNVSDWVPAMRAVGEAPGEVCYTYPSCMALIREGKDIDYEGVTGPGTFSEGGVNVVTPAYLPFVEGVDEATGEPAPVIGEPVLLDAEKGKAILEEIQTQVTCDESGSCSW